MIPKLCKDGVTVFHQNHPRYTEWVRDALSKIDKKSGDDVLIFITQLEVKIKTEMEIAWNANVSINKHFDNLINSGKLYK